MTIADVRLVFCCMVFMLGLAHIAYELALVAGMASSADGMEVINKLRKLIMRQLFCGAVISGSALAGILMEGR